MGMVGGGKDAFIGAIHRLAANMDGLIEIVAGALSINPEIAKESGRMIFLPEDRTYLTFEEMIEKESKLPKEKRIDYRYPQLCSLCTGHACLGKRVSCGD
jgi:hypothetical protein